MTTSPSLHRNGAGPSASPSATWAVHEAPTSCCLRWQVGKLEFMLLAESMIPNYQRLAHAVPWLLALVKVWTRPSCPGPLGSGVLPCEHHAPAAPRGAEDCVHAMRAMGRAAAQAPGTAHRLTMVPTARQIREGRTMDPSAAWQPFSMGCRPWPAIHQRPPARAHLDLQGLATSLDRGGAPPILAATPPSTTQTR